MLRMTRDALLDLYRRCGALLEGHFRLTSGLHSSGYLQCALVLQHPQHAEALGRAIADLTREMLLRLGEDPEREGLVRTPERMAHGMAQIYSRVTTPEPWLAPLRLAGAA